MKYRKSIIFFAATLTLMARVASSEGELSALELTLSASDDVINKNVSEDQELLNDGDVFSERYTLDQVFLFEQLIENYCSNLKLDSPNKGHLENRIVKYIGDNELLSSRHHNDIEIREQRSKVAVALLSVMRTSCGSLNSVADKADSLKEQDGDELQALNKLNEELAVELLENGFVSVDDGEIADWESLLALNGPFLVDQKAVSEKLRFEPTSFIEQDGLEYIGSEAIGAIAKEGSDSVVSLYKTDFGAVSITETDISDYASADTDDDTQSYFETTKVGESEVLSLVMRGKTTGEFETQLLWADELLNREYTISVNMNANDPTSSSHLENLFALVNKISN